ncbi:MAG: GNAT family N-acetyltransferase [Chthoniobacteraceae bacterium]|nr:GNAT family N-acetyltransferase [Chthoniobacteraceae bacterium]
MITEATLEDVPQLCDMLGELFAQETDFRPDRAKQSAGLRLLVGNLGFGRIFVERRGGTLVAMVNLLTVFSASQGGRALLLEDLIVRRAFRGKGIATSLLQHTVRFAQSIGAVQITLLTDSTNARAIRLYQKAGFSRVGAGPVRMSLPSQAG